jgi:predicted nucleic acid-binding protein
MVGVLFDTNILIDYLNGVEETKYELERYSDTAISRITWLEVMTGAAPETEDILRGFLNGFINLPIDERVSNCAVILRNSIKSSCRMLSFRQPRRSINACLSLAIPRIFAR